MNDVKYLNLESKRFSLRSFRFRFADTQFVYMNRIGVFNRQFANLYRKMSVLNVAVFVLIQKKGLHMQKTSQSH